MKPLFSEQPSSFSGPTPELYSQAKESLEVGVREALDALERETVGALPEVMTPQEVKEAAKRMRQGELHYLEGQTHSTDEKVAARARFMQSTKGQMDTLVDNGTQAEIAEFLTRTREQMKEMGGDDENIQAAIEQIERLIELDQSLGEGDEKSRALLLTLTSLGMDLVPFIGGLKMVAEGAAGKTLDGETLEGVRRLAHAAEGMMWEVVDVAAVAAGLLSGGAGGVAVEVVAKGAKVAGSVPRVSRVLTRTGAFMHKNGIQGSKEVFKVGRVLQKNEAAEKVAQKAFERGLKQRNNRVVRAAEAIPEAMSDFKDTRAAQVEMLNQINTEREQLTALLAQIGATGEPLAA